MFKKSARARNIRKREDQEDLADVTKTEQEDETNLVIRRNHDSHQRSATGLLARSNRPAAPVDFRSFIDTGMDQIEDNVDAPLNLNSHSPFAAETTQLELMSMNEDDEMRRRSLPYGTTAESIEPELAIDSNIPDQDFIALAKKKRQLSRERSSRRPNNDRFGLIQAANNMSLDVDEHTIDSVLLVKTHLNEDDDDIYGTFEDYNGDKLVFGDAAVETLRQKHRGQIREALEDHSFDATVTSDSHPEDEDMVEWERSQIYKGASGVKDLDAAFLGQHRFQSSSSYVDIPAFDILCRNLENHLNEVRLQSGARSQELDRLSEHVARLSVKEQANKEYIETIGVKYYFFQDLGSWLKGLNYFLAARKPLLIKLEKEIDQVQEGNTNTLKDWNKLDDITGDVKDIFCDMKCILTRFETWAKLYRRDYEDAYVRDSMIDVLEFFIKHSLFSEWSLLEKDNGEYKSICSLYWYQMLSKFGELTSTQTDDAFFRGESKYLLETCVENFVITHMKLMLTQFDLSNYKNRTWLKNALADIARQVSDGSTVAPFAELKKAVEIRCAALNIPTSSIM